MSQPSVPEIEQLNHARRALWPWRLAFVAYALVLVVLTHWPNLQITHADAPPRDKILHWLFLGGFTILLWRTRWLRRGWDVVFLALACATLDELTQGWFVPGRPFSAHDLVANLLGVSSAGFVIAAMRPVGGPVNRIRVHRFEFIIDTLLARPRAWLALLPLTTGLGLLVGAVVWSSTRWYHGSADVGASFVAVAVGGIAGALVAIAWLFRQELQRFCDRRSCAQCGASCGAIDVNETGGGECESCGRPFHPGQWIITADLPRSVLSRLAVRSLVPSAIIAGVLLAIYAVVVTLHMNWPEFRRVVTPSLRTAERIGSPLDMTIVSALGALVLHRFRAGMARVFDRQAERCRMCGHDVHATPTERGIGRCPECGTEFMRLST